MTQQLNSKSQLSQNIQAGGDIKHRKKWQAIETQKYCQFIQRNRSTLQETQKKQKQRIYNKMAQYIGTRTTHQCRSHHQKIMKRYTTIDAFIQTFIKRYDPIMTYGRYIINDTMGGAQWSKSSGQQINKPNINLNQAHNQLKHLTQPQFRTFQVQTNQINQEKQKNFQNNFYLPNKIQNNNFHPFPKTFSSTFKIIQNPSTTQKSSTEYDISKKSFQTSNNSQNNSTGHPTIVKTIILNNNQNNQNLMNQNSIKNYNNGNSGSYNNFSYYGNNLQKNHDQKRSYSNSFQIQPNYNFFHPSNNQEGQFTTTLKPTKRKNKNPLIPSYEVLKDNPETLFSNASQICSSILYKKNLNVINPLVIQNRIELTNTTIKIKGKEQDDYKIWVQCVKQQQKSDSSSKVNSDSQQIQRQLVKQIVIDILANQDLLENNINEHYLDRKQYIDKMMPLDRNIPPYYFDQKLFNIESNQQVNQPRDRWIQMSERQKISQPQQKQNLQNYKLLDFPYQHKAPSQQQIDNDNKNEFQQNQVEAKIRNYYRFLQTMKRINRQKKQKIGNASNIKPHLQHHFQDAECQKSRFIYSHNQEVQNVKNKYIAPTGTGDDDQQDNHQILINNEQNNYDFNNFNANISQKNQQFKLRPLSQSIKEDKKQNIKEQIKQNALQFSSSLNQKQKK